MAFFTKFASKPDAVRNDSDLVSIVSNLNNILNTKRDYGSFLHDFGIRDLNEYTSQNDIAIAVINEVKENIERYEPRVEVTNITRVEDKNPFHLAFNIECVFRENSQALHMVFDSVFNNIQIENLR